MLVIERKPNSMDAEAYRSLRANVEFLALDKKHKVIIITSYLAGEGKSIVAANLAYSLANGHKKVLLLDFNFRNPSIEAIDKINKANGDIIGIVLNDVKRGRNKKRKKRNRRKQANIGEDEAIKEVHPRSYMEV